MPMATSPPGQGTPFPPSPSPYLSHFYRPPAYHLFCRRYWSDSLVVDSIQKDVIRTYPDLHFFLEREGECQMCLQNILFLYAKLNPGIKYVQVTLSVYLYSLPETSTSFTLGDE
jgi:hypothetical protein